jgi:hypothetical protein
MAALILCPLIAILSEVSEAVDPVDLDLPPAQFLEHFRDFRSDSDPDTSWSTMVLNVVKAEAGQAAKGWASQLIFSEQLFSTPLMNSIMAVACGYMMHKMCRLSVTIMLRVIPPLFMFLEVLAQTGFIGDANKGFVDWARHTNVTAMVEESMQVDFPSPADAEPMFAEMVSVVLSRGVLVTCGFLAAFIV